MKIKALSLLIIICLIGFLLRVWNISEVPASLSHDEVAIGYNAYSILTTGRDEYGNRLPILFKSFDDYKLPGYIYFTSLSEKFFGLTELAVRFPSVLLGTLTIALVFFLAQELSVTDRMKKIFPFFVALLLALSPWHINFSRAAFESNGSVFFITLGILSLLLALKKPVFFLLSALACVVSLYFYYTSRVVLPICIFIFLGIYWEKAKVFKKWVFLAFILGGILLLPLLPQMFTAGLSRINQVSIFEDKVLTNPYSEAIVRNNNSVLAKIAFNRRLAYFQEFTNNYLRNFAPDFYFASGTGPMGLLYVWELPFFFYGIHKLMKLPTLNKWIILSWFLSVPLVGGLTTGQPNALRTLPNVVIASLFSGLGVFYFYEKYRISKMYKLLSLSFVLIVVFFLFRFILLYFSYQSYISAVEWGDGHKQLAQFIRENKSVYNSIYITGEYWRPYIYLLFYMQYPPLQYQQNGSSYRIENIIFGQASWDKDKKILLSSVNLRSLEKEKTLFVLSKNDFLSQKNLIESEKRNYKLKTVKEINGRLIQNVFYAVTLE